jgi:hypothetical protein
MINFDAEKAPDSMLAALRETQGLALLDGGFVITLPQTARLNERGKCLNLARSFFCRSAQIFGAF